MPEAGSCDATKKLQSKDLSSTAPSILTDIHQPKSPAAKQNKSTSKYCEFIVSPPQNQGPWACKPLLCEAGKNQCAVKAKSD